MNKPFVTIQARCGYTRMVIKQTPTGLYYFVKRGTDRNWSRISPKDVLDYVPSVEECDTQVWVKTKNGWRYIEGISLELQKSPEIQNNEWTWFV